MLEYTYETALDINQKCLEASRLRDLMHETLLSVISESLPIVGNHFKKKNLLEKCNNDQNGIDKVLEAFNLGYVPGASYSVRGPTTPEYLIGKRRAWSTSLVRFYDFDYHPDNKEYVYEIKQLLKERLAESNISSVPSKLRPKSGYEVFLNVSAILDLEGLSPPMKNKPRSVDFGNPDKNYWRNWGLDIRNHIQATITEVKNNNTINLYTRYP